MMNTQTKENDTGGAATTQQLSPQQDTEGNMASMDDVQFKASLDMLLDSELAHSASNSTATGFVETTTTAAPVAVSADPSVASSASSIVTSTAVPRPLTQPRGVVLPPPKVRSAPGPSPLTARLAYMTTSLPQQQSMSSSVAMTKPPPTTKTPRAGEKRRRGASLILEDEEEKQRRRQERNAREQQRSQKITDQITYLRKVLAEANVPCKPDKHSTLVSVVNYIHQLQERSSMLDEQHAKLLETVTKTNEMVNTPYYQAMADKNDAPVDLLSEAQPSSSLDDEHAVFVQGLDYKSVFAHCGIALAVASIDGRFMDCNREFEQVSGYSRQELLPGHAADGAAAAPTRNLSLFNLLQKQDMESVFLAMSSMLKMPLDASTTAAAPNHQDYWSGVVRPNREEPSTQLRMNITLVRTPGGRPKFFNCALTLQDTTT